MLGFCWLQATWGMPKTASHTGTRTRQTQAILFVRVASRRAFSRPGVRGLTLWDRSSIWDKFKTPMGAAPPRGSPTTLPGRDSQAAGGSPLPRA